MLVICLTDEENMRVKRNLVLLKDAENTFDVARKKRKPRTENGKKKSLILKTRNRQLIFLGNIMGKERLQNFPF